MEIISLRDLRLIREAFDKIENNYKKKWIEYENMYNSIHPDEYLSFAKRSDRNAIFIPLTYSTINIANSIFTNAFFASGNPIELRNVGENDKIKRDELTQVVDYYYHHSRPYTELSKAFLSAGIYGSGAVHVSWDENSPKTSMIPLSDISFDPEAVSVGDIGYIAHRFSQTLEQISQKLSSGFYECDPHREYDLKEQGRSSPYSRREIYEIFKKKEDGYEVKTYLDSLLLRKRKFRRCPIKYGMLLQKLPSIDRTKREKEIAAIGESLVNIISPLNKELNVKRNQRMDIIERHLNPELFVPDSCGLDPDDALRNGGIKRCDDTAGIKPGINGAGAVEFSQDIAMLQKDIEDASSINGILRGNTSASDRRSQAALATVNANSSTRLESMVKLINETLFEHWAKDFVRLCYLNAPDELIKKILEKDSHSLGTKGFREELSVDISINFGANLNKEQKIQHLISIVQMVGNSKNADVTGVMEEIITLSLGENVDAKRILGISQMQGDEDSREQTQGGDEEDTESGLNEQSWQKAHHEDDIRSQRDDEVLELYQARENII